MTLTSLAVSKAKPREKSYKITDERGLYLLVTPTGGRYWRLKYRFGGKDPRHARTIIDLSWVTLSTA